MLVGEKKSGLHPRIECLSEFTTFEQGLLKKKVNASLATSGTGNAGYSIHWWSTQTSDGKEWPSNVANTSANAHQGIQ